MRYRVWRVFVSLVFNMQNKRAVIDF